MVVDGDVLPRLGALGLALGVSRQPYAAYYLLRTQLTAHSPLLPFGTAYVTLPLTLPLPLPLPLTPPLTLRVARYWVLATCSSPLARCRQLRIAPYPYP